MKVAVVGGGISGLAAAHRVRTLLGPAAEVTVLEQRDRIGGVLRTVELAGLPFDVGAEAFLARRPEVAALAAELGVDAAIVHPTGAAASIRAGGRLGPLPGGTVMGVPGSAAALDGLLSPAGVAAARAERERELRWEAGGDVALGALLRDRFGNELADRLADPLLGGVYAGRVDALGLRATVPGVAAALDRGARTLTAAADSLLPRESRSTAPRVAVDGTPSRCEVAESIPVFGAFRGGYRVLLDALAPAAAVRLGTTVRELHRTGGGWRLVLGPTTTPETLDVDAVVLAVPAPALAKLLAAVAPTAAQAAGRVELASSAVVAMAFAGITPPATSGVLIAADEPFAIKAATHSSSKWAHLGADGLVRLRASLGRFGEAASLQVDDAELVARARADLATLTGITAAPVDVHVQRWGGGLPQYGVGHLDVVSAIENGLPDGLAVAGSALHGVGVPACVATARAAVDKICAT